MKKKGKHLPQKGESKSEKNNANSSKDESDPKPWRKRDISLLETQVGFYPEDEKRAFLRSANPDYRPKLQVATFSVISEGDEKTVFQGKVDYWGEKWQSLWWVLDYSALRASGSFHIEIPHLEDQWGDFRSTAFNITDSILFGARFLDIALDQLDERLEKTPEEIDISEINIWRDCGSRWIAEITAIGIALHGLVDIYERLFQHLSDQDQSRLLSDLEVGGDYILSSQIHSENPLHDGLFEHSRQSRLLAPPGIPERKQGECGHVIWHDAAYTIAVLVRISEALREHNPEKADAYLEAAVKAYRVCVKRPYNLEGDFEEYIFSRDENGKRVLEPGTKGKEYLSKHAKYMYNKTAEWRMPTTLRTKSKLALLWSCTLLHKVTGPRHYLEKALEMADSIADRQFTNWKNPIEGAYGSFFEFEGDDSAFMVEMGQSFGWLMGNIEPANLKGFIDLIELLPGHPQVAKWHNVVKTWIEGYVKKTADLTPLGIYPAGCYRDPDNEGIKYFQTLTHGALCMYGQIAKNLLETGGFLNDRECQRLAVNNTQFVIGLNPGFPDAYRPKAWRAISLLKGVGKHAFPGSTGLTAIPNGSGMSGFMAFPQFTHHYIYEGDDLPNGILKPSDKYHFNEDWLCHSHGYVSAAAILESPFELEITATENGNPVRADIIVELPEKTEIHTDTQGRVVLTSLPVQRKGTVSVTWEEKTFSRPLETLSGARLTWEVDFAHHLEIQLSLPPLIQGSPGSAGEVKVGNHGTQAVKARLVLFADGVDVEPDSFDIDIPKEKTMTLKFQIQPGERRMPFQLVAQVSYGGKLFIGTARGLVDPGADEKPSTAELPSAAEIRDDMWHCESGMLSIQEDKLGDTFYYFDKRIDAPEILYEAVVIHRGGRHAGLVFRADEDAYPGRVATPCYAVLLDKTDNLLKLIQTSAWSGGKIASMPMAVEYDREYPIEIRCCSTDRGTDIRVSIDGREMLSHDDSVYAFQGPLFGAMVSTMRPFIVSAVFKDIKIWEMREGKRGPLLYDPTGD